MRWTSQETGREDYETREMAVQATWSSLRGRFPSGTRFPAPQEQTDGSVRFFAPHLFPLWSGEYVGCVFESPAVV